MVDSREIVDRDRDPSMRMEPLLPSDIIKSIAGFVLNLTHRLTERVDALADDVATGMGFRE